MNMLYPAVQVTLIICATLVVLTILGKMGGPKK